MSSLALPLFDARTLLDSARSLQKINGGNMHGHDAGPSRPTQFALHEKGTTVYLRPELRAQAEDEAAASSYRKLSPFLSDLIDQMLNFRFLSSDNLEFIRSISRQLGGPWDTVLVLNRIVAYVRGEVTSQRLILSGFFFQQRNGKKKAAR